MPPRPSRRQTIDIECRGRPDQKSGTFFAEAMTYTAFFGLKAPLNNSVYDNYYYLECHGANHTNAGLEGHYPAYNAIQGLLERAPKT